MVCNCTFLGEAKCRWVPTQEANASHTGGTYLWVMPIRSPPTAMRFRHRGRVLLLSGGAALQSDRGLLRREIRP